MHSIGREWMNFNYPEKQVNRRANIKIQKGPRSTMVAAQLISPRGGITGTPDGTQFYNNIFYVDGTVGYELDTHTNTVFENNDIKLLIGAVAFPKSKNLFHNLQFWLFYESMLTYLKIDGNKNV